MAGEEDDWWADRASAVKTSFKKEPKTNKSAQITTTCIQPILLAKSKSKPPN